MEEMSLEEAIKILNRIKLGKKADTKAPNKVYASQANLSVIAIERVLEELDRRIAPEVIEEKIEEIEKWISMNEQARQSNKRFIAILKELLNKE